MSDQAIQLAEKYLRDILREFSIAFRRHSREQVPTLTLRITGIVEGESPSVDKEIIVTPVVLDAFAELLAREARTATEDPKLRYVRVMSFERSRHPWYDVSVEAGPRSFLFRVHKVHPIEHLQSST